MYMKKRSILGTAAIIICFCIGIFYFKNYYSTINIADNKMIAKEIVSKDIYNCNDIELVNIIDKQYNKNECFVLFQCGDNPYSLAIFEEASIDNKKRYRYSGGSNQSSRYGTYRSGQGPDEVLTVVYGDNNYINADYFELSFPSRTIIKQEIENKDFMYVYRFYSSDSCNGDLRFYDKSGKEI